ncbi:family 10 glycosylhydrolase [Candidatus Cloacimonadota bacterium]
MNGIDMQYSIWMNSKNRNSDGWKKDFAKLRKAGISNVFLSGNMEDIENALKFSNDFNLNVHNWIFTMICNDEEIIKHHPDWFTVNGLGERSCDKPQYVGYYKWLCPTNPEVQEFLLDRVESLYQISELAGVHLDYIRYCDVILPKALQPNYNLVQTREEPQFDYCYCEHCRSAFKSRSGIDPLELKNPSENQEWLQFRYDSISNIVTMLKTKIHQYNKKITAAVFPTIMQQNVRQVWHKWDLDAVYPMLYHSLYGQGLAWIEEETRKGKSLLKSTKLNSGLYIPAIKPNELVQVIKAAKDGGADGVSLFDFNAMKDEHWDELNPTNPLYKLN